MNDRDEAILGAARAIRPFLPQLVGTERAGDVDRELAELLVVVGGGGTAHDELLARLLAHPATRQWWLGYLQTRVPPEVAAATGEAVRAELPGRGNPDPRPRYLCPIGNDYDWYRFRPGTPVPACPTHHVPLQAAPEPR